MKELLICIIVFLIMILIEMYSEYKKDMKEQEENHNDGFNSSRIDYSNSFDGW